MAQLEVPAHMVRMDPTGLPLLANLMAQQVIQVPPLAELALMEMVLMEEEDGKNPRAKLRAVAKGAGEVRQSVLRNLPDEYGRGANV
jgi:hypothetical protein